MDIRPVDLPELRGEMLDFLLSPNGANYWQDMARRRLFLDGSAEMNRYGTEFLEAETLRVNEAKLFFISPEMTQLAITAGRTLPDFKVEDADMPSPFGLMYFADPIQRSERAGTPIVACTWGRSWVGSDKTLLWFSLYADTVGAANAGLAAGVIDQAHADRMIRTRPRLMYEGEAACWMGRDAEGVSPDSALAVVGKTVRAAWLLMQQPLARSTELEIDRVARKRLRRSGHEPKPVRVIELRRTAHSGPGDGSREFHHQWIVRGHWRQQWYPARGVHRPVWIAPHIKGPEGAPLLGGEKVYAWKR
jgi:hypothetical protein